MEVSCIIIKITGDKFIDLDICGKKTIDWVKDYCIYPYDIIEVDKLGNVIDYVKNYQNSKYVIVTFANMPLVYPETITELVDYIQMKKLQCAKVGNICIFDTDYIKNNTFSRDYQEMFTDDTAQFLVCDSYEKYNIICDIMKGNIIRSVMKNGVILKNSNCVYIDANSYIGKNSVINGNCRIVNSVIGDNANIGLNNDIENCNFENDIKIGNNNTIYNSKIGANIGNNCVIDTCKIGKSGIIESSNLTHSILGNNVKVNAYNVIEYSQIEDNVVFGNFNKIKNKKIPVTTEIKDYTK